MKEKRRMNYRTERGNERKKNEKVERERERRKRPKVDDVAKLKSVSSREKKKNRVDQRE
jgi:hypothetical protein